jgi:hypothetical protein
VVGAILFKAFIFESGPTIGRKHELASNDPQAKEMFIADSSWQKGSLGDVIA